jgi:predicted ArsR family transcriptional regulator
MSERLNAAGDPELRKALIVARSQPAGVTADDAAAALGIHRNVARARLDRLVSAGFLRVVFARRTGRVRPGAGRPAKVYEVAPETQTIEFPERGFDELSQFLIDELDPATLRRVGVEYGRRLARRSRVRANRDAAKGMRRLCERLGANGFQVTVVDAGPDGATLACPTCPLRPVVRRSDDAIVVDRGMWAALAESAVAGVHAEEASCTTEGCSADHATCRVVITFSGDHA